MEIENKINFLEREIERRKREKVSFLSIPEWDKEMFRDYCFLAVLYRRQGKIKKARAYTSRAEEELTNLLEIKNSEIHFSDAIQGKPKYCGNRFLEAENQKHRRINFDKAEEYKKYFRILSKTANFVGREITQTTITSLKASRWPYRAKFTASFPRALKP